MACKAKISSGRPVAFLFVCVAQTTRRTIVRVFHKRTKLAILTLLSTLYYIQVIIYSFLCCDMGQNDTIGKIELNPSFVLSSDETNCKNDIQLFHQLFDELSVNRDYH